MSARVMQIFMSSRSDWVGERSRGTCSDRCEFPVGGGMIECFWGCGLLPLSLPGLGHQRCARALPPLFLWEILRLRAQDAVFTLAAAQREDRERKTGDGGERERERKRQIKRQRKRSSQADVQDRSNIYVSFLNRRAMADFSLCKSSSPERLNQTAGVWPRKFTPSIVTQLYQTHCGSVGFCESARFIHCWKQHLKEVIWGIRADKYWLYPLVVWEQPKWWTLSFILFHCLWLSPRQHSSTYLYSH